MYPRAVSRAAAERRERSGGAALRAAALSRADCPLDERRTRLHPHDPRGPGKPDSGPRKADSIQEGGGDECSQEEEGAFDQPHKYEAPVVPLTLPCSI